MTVPTALDTRFRDAAAAEGLLDVAYDLVDTPVGQLLVAVTDHGVCEISYDPEPEREASSSPARSASASCARPSRRTRRGASSTSTSPASARVFDLPLDLRQARDFGRAVLDELARVPYGELTTYGTLAARRRPPPRRPRGRDGHEPEPRADRPPVPPGRRLDGLAGRLRGRPRPQAHAARAGRLAAEGLTRALAARRGSPRR